MRRARLDAAAAASCRGALAITAWLAVAPAQDPAAPLSGPALVARLRTAALPLAEAQLLAADLASLPVPLRLQASDALRDRVLDRCKAHGKACDDVARSLAKTVAAVTAKAKGAPEPDDLRQRALAVSRRDGLTKQAIESEIDPLVAQLEALLWPTRDALCARDPTLAPALDALRLARDELAQWFACYRDSLAGLELNHDAVRHLAKVAPPPPPPTAAALDDECTVWTLLAMPLSARDRRALEANEQLRAASDAEEFAGTTALNRLRFLLGLPLLRIDEKLTAAARDHSTDMVTLGFFDHSSPVAGKHTPWERAARFGTSANAENIAAGHGTGPGAVRGWWYSPGHHRNMLGNHARTGLGRHRETWTQMFGG